MDVFEVMNREAERIRNIIRNKEEQEWDKRFENAHIQKSELIETNVNLSSQIKHLKDLQADQDKEVERLRELLKECSEVLEDIKKDRGIYFNNLNLTDILTRIKIFIGESEK